MGVCKLQRDKSERKWTKIKKLVPRVVSTESRSLLRPQQLNCAAACGTFTTSLPNPRPHTSYTETCVHIARCPQQQAWDHRKRLKTNKKNTVHETVQWKLGCNWLNTVNLEIVTIFHVALSPGNSYFPPSL